MCRFLAYLGEPVNMGDLLFAPANSIVKQSYAAREIEEPLNGDGFGVGWYHHDRTPDPAVFVSVSPAWNNRNLRYLAPKVRSHCILAHVRAASVGDVAEANCHPFHHADRLLMHNGGVERFDRIKRALVNELSDERYRWIAGQTDSEHLFALLLDRLRPQGAHATVEEVADAFEAMFTVLKAEMRTAGITEAAWLNMVYSDGRILVASRYVTDAGEEPLTLYYSEGKRFQCAGGTCRMLPAEGPDRAVLIVSEKLDDLTEEWTAVPAQSLVLVDHDLRVSVRGIRS
ncbi:MAG: class II glutamine amidotransferase [Bacteroidetes bacterium]|nr:class II glutamine amidotransferase [Bacteroidota bacterium]